MSTPGAWHRALVAEQTLKDTVPQVSVSALLLIHHHSQPSWEASTIIIIFILWVREPSPRVIHSLQVVGPGSLFPRHPLKGRAWWLLFTNRCTYLGSPFSHCECCTFINNGGGFVKLTASQELTDKPFPFPEILLPGIAWSGKTTWWRWLTLAWAGWWQETPTQPTPGPSSPSSGRRPRAWPITSSPSSRTSGVRPLLRFCPHLSRAGLCPHCAFSSCLCSSFFLALSFISHYFILFLFLLLLFHLKNLFSHVFSPKWGKSEVFFFFPLPK